jgi:hypothetical protein
MTASFVVNTRAEFLKTKQTAAFWLTVIGSAFIPAINCIGLITHPRMVARFANDPWKKMLADNWQPAAFMLLPVYVILVTSLIVQVEYRNNTWKQVYASPRSVADIFFSRFLVIHSMILFSFLLFSLFIVIAACIANLARSQYTFFEHAIPVKQFFTAIARNYFAVLSITAIQYWLSLRFKNFITAMGIGLGLFITGFIIHKWEYLYCYPYMYSVIMNMPQLQHLVPKTQLFNVIWFVGGLGLALADTVTRKERG